jgi:hypothetical protein
MFTDMKLSEIKSLDEVLEIVVYEEASLMVWSSHDDGIVCLVADIMF